MKIFISLLLFGLLFSSQGWAALVIEGSRVIFSSDQREGSLRLMNGSDKPILVQAWVDDGSAQGTPQNAGDVPVIPLPSLFRIEPRRPYTLRLLATPITLPQDRESLFWLNLNEIPASSPQPQASPFQLKVQVRMQLKLLYRPVQIRDSVDKRTASQQFQLLRENGEMKLKVTNPTPFYAIYSRAEIETAGQKAQPVELAIFAPFESKTLSLPESITWTPKRIRFALINDQGNEEVAEKKL